MLSLKTNYLFQDLLLGQAAKAEARGDSVLANWKLADALAADVVFEKSRNQLRGNTVCAESVLEFVEEFEEFSEPVDYSDMPEYRFALMTQKTKRVKRMKLRRLNATVSPRTNTKKEDER